MLLNELIVDDNNMGFVPSIGASFQMNDIAKEIISLLKEDKQKDEIVQIISDKYDISSNNVYIDISDFMKKLKIYGII